MLRLPTTLLQHDRREDRHYDWLILDPAAPGGPGVPGPAYDHPLLTFRLHLPSHCWANASSLLLTPLPYHRINYLTYQGPVSGNRGCVRRIDQGHVTPRLWTPTRIALDLHLHRFTGRATLRKFSPDRWTATVISE